MQNKKIVYGVVGIVLLVGAFYGGIIYGKSQTGTRGENGFATNMQNRTGQFGMNNGNNRINGGGFIAGEIIAKDDKSITVKLTDGGSKIIFFDASVAVSKMTTGSLSDLSTGAQISLTGTTNSDGSITAKSIQIRPQARPATQTQ